MNDPVEDILRYLAQFAPNEAHRQLDYYHAVLARLEKAEAELAVDARYIDEVKAKLADLQAYCRIIEEGADSTQAKLDALKAECKRKDEALSYYAYGSSVDVDDDGGQRARDAITAPRGKT